MYAVNHLPAGVRTRRSVMHVVKDLTTPLNRRRPMERADVVRMIDNMPTFDNSMQTYDRATIDAAGVFLIGELEKLDPTLHQPLLAYTWRRDIDLREDVTVADEESSWTNSNIASQNSVNSSNKAWVTKTSNAIPTVMLDIGKTAQPLSPWGIELKWSIFELESAKRIGRDIVSAKIEGVQRKWNMDADEQVYMGDTTLGLGGMFNHPLITNVGNASNGSWSSATAAAILADFNAALLSAWGSTGTALPPNKVLIDPASFNILATTIVSNAGNLSLLGFLIKNNIVALQRQPLDIQPVKWLTGTGNTFGGFTGMGPAATNSLFVYRQEKTMIRIPVIPLLRTPPDYRGIFQHVTYYSRIGVVEPVYPETCVLRSGL